jgi:hypothetical protein
MIGSVLPGAALGEKMAAKSVKRSNDMSSTILATRTIVILGFALLIASPALARNDKVQVCHVPPGNPANAHEISISEKAVEAHLRNHEGDALGACPEAVACPCWTEEDLNGALEAAAADPDVIVEDCELIIDDADEEHPEEIEFDAELEFESFDGDDVRVHVSSIFERSSCYIDFDEDDLGLGLEEIERDISIEEAGECARIVGRACVDLLP